ncbi:hypothetical protein SeMB42_g05599 [Synchytrium endobioticum]|uniref:Proteasome assembly chaperone 3 n=1 Tax=Synchytrium endobioticum TaxID=286115 RepID=A0A507CQL6_9FUNG|nr:hypothetical protein SeLEV6574_g07089 [Synchytrium endobioticum]TPX41378.1 hypothetical protein SeMB42_g05599 [Synchytrium endobioticum]
MATGSRIQVRSFVETYLGRAVYVQITLLEKQMVCWVGTEQGRFGGLGSAVKTRYSNTAAGTTLLSTGVDDASENVAKRLASKYQDWQFFVSINLPAHDEDMVVFGERALGRVVKSIVDQRSG